MYLIGIFASPIPYLAILGIYLSGFACIKFWPAQVEEDLPEDALTAEVASLPELALQDEATLWVDDFSEAHALASSENAFLKFDFSFIRYPVFYHSRAQFFWPSQRRVRPPPVG